MCQSLTTGDCGGVDGGCCTLKDRVATSPHAKIMTHVCADTADGTIIIVSTNQKTAERERKERHDGEAVKQHVDPNRSAVE